MEISDDDRRILEELQRDLDAEDPAFVRKMEGASLFSRDALIGLFIFLAGVAVLLGGVALNFPPVGVGGFVIMVYGAYKGIPAGLKLL